jgi:uncharacterized membrane protein
MKNLSDIGRIFYGVAIAVLGLLTIYYSDFPYMLIPRPHKGIPGLSIIAWVSGSLILFAGASIVFNKKVRLASVLLGIVMLVVFCFYYVPHQFMTGSYWPLVAWENAEKELALCAGAFVMAGCVTGQKGTSRFDLQNIFLRVGSVLFAITMISFGIIHFQYASDVADYVPSWIPFRLFWAYLAGAGLVASGMGIILKIKRRLAAILLGSMILIWFIVLHIPRIIVSPVAYLGSEIASAMLALGYSGIAFLIAGRRVL